MVRHPSLSSALLLFSLAVVPLLSPSPHFLAYFRSAPATPSPYLLFSLFSFYRAPHPYPLTCCLPACLVSSLLHPLPRCLLLPPSSDFRSTHGFPPPPPFCLSLFQVGFFFFFLMVPGWVWVSRLLLGLPLPWLTRRLCVCFSLSCSRSYLRLASLSPASPPFSLRFWVIQRFLCFLPLLLVFQGVIPLSLDPSTSPLAVGSARSSCCSRFVCFCAFFPLTLMVTPSASLLLVLFHFLPPAALMSPSLPLPCCGRRLSSLYGWFVAGLPHPDIQ